jgi:site-specific DNA-methyltransferase (adenine-specific)
MVVMDNTMGSGTTGLACKNTNRSFIGIEKDENYFKIAEQRINARTLFS